MNTNKLIVRTFGGFSMEWNGKVLTGGTRSSDTQLIRLIQVLLHCREQGADRIQLMEILDDDSVAEDVHHLFRSVLYNLRKKLKEYGLPESRYIEFRGGRYYWTDDIPVYEDAKVFEEVCRKNELETDADKRGKLSLEACYLYRGDFLPQQTRLIWVSEEERRYSRMFRECVESAAGYLRAANDYAGLEALGKHASKVAPFNEWEVLTMEALIALGKYRDAQKLYEKTVNRYHKEMGVRPSSAMIDKLETFSTRLGLRSGGPDLIIQDLSETSIEKGGYYCSYYSFQSIYRMIRRSMDRTGRRAYLMICTLINRGAGDEAAVQHTNETAGRHTDASSVQRPDAAAGQYTDDAALHKLSEKVKDVICGSLRRSDIVCRYSAEQYLIILLNKDLESCNIVRDRIDRNFEAEGLGLKPEYYIYPIKELS